LLSSRIAAESLVANIGRRIHETLTPLLQGHRTCALVGFPNHANVGDSAIWLGQEAFLRDSGVRVVYRCDATNYSARRLSTRLDRGVILLSGGGNLGDLYPDHQRLREAVIQDFPQHKVIQLPQSIHFIDPRNCSRARAIFNAHPDLTLMVRDPQSLEIARNEFRTTSLLCPDMAFALGRLARPMPPVVKIVWLARSDREAKYNSLVPINQDVERFDWVIDAPSLIASLDRLLRWLLVRYPRRVHFLQHSVTFNYRRLAMTRLARGLGLLARGRVVITDRLHGCILSLLMGLPHVALDNSYGKVKAFHATWTELGTMTHWAESPEDALQQAVALEATVI
jgi:exopolysaccharide biosynthesis predicted pyruvyltransferase EpsI